MKYKPGDKVRIKTWEQMEEEYGKNDFGSIKTRVSFFVKMERDIKKIKTDRILTIGRIVTEDLSEEFMIWTAKETTMWDFSSNIIECLLKEYEESFIPINSRFEILDL